MSLSPSLFCTSFLLSNTIQITRDHYLTGYKNKSYQSACPDDLYDRRRSHQLIIEAETERMRVHLCVNVCGIVRQ